MAKSSGLKSAQSPSGSRKVEMPDSAETPAPVRTTTDLALFSRERSFWEKGLVWVMLTGEKILFMANQIKLGEIVIPVVLRLVLDYFYN